MKPYYSSKGITIYHGDCREVLPKLEKSFDLLLTDPPYGIGESRGKNKSRGKWATSRDYGFSRWDDNPPTTETIQLIQSYARWQIIFGGNFFNLPAMSCWLVWDKDNGETDFADCELAWTNLKKAVRKFKWRWQGMLQENMKSKDIRFHPTQKPEAVMRWCIQQAPKDCLKIIDPFMGNGTTLHAAKDLGRRAIGIEIEEKYCEIAAKRLDYSQAVNKHKKLKPLFKI